jgi:hypothetical protein
MEEIIMLLLEVLVAVQILVLTAEAAMLAVIVQ